MSLLKEYIHEYRANTPRCSFLQAVRWYPLWRLTITQNLDPLSLRLPWTVMAAYPALAWAAKQSSMVAEFGGGGSTLYFLDRAGCVVTVEHEKTWFRKLESEVSQHRNGSSWTGHLVPSELLAGANSHSDPSHPDHYVSSEDSTRSYLRYASQLDSYPDGCFSCILIDGRARPSCLKHAIPKLQPGGILVYDNTDREYYLSQRVKELLQSFRTAFDAYGPAIGLRRFTRTSVFQLKSR